MPRIFLSPPFFKNWVPTRLHSVPCLTFLFHGNCLDICRDLQAGGGKVFPEYAIIYRRQYDKTKVRSDADGGFCMHLARVFHTISSHKLIICLNLLFSWKLAVFYIFVLNSAKMKVENPFKTANVFIANHTFSNQSQGCLGSDTTNLYLIWGQRCHIFSGPSRHGGPNYRWMS